MATPFVSSNQSIYFSPANGLGQNYSRAGTPQIDQLLNQALQQPDQDKQADLTNQADALLWDQMATLPLYQKPTFLAYSSTLNGAEDNATQAGPFWNSNTWSLKQ